jgi:hypothetical protein
MLRAESARIGDENGTIKVPIATEEDIITSKLQWYWLNEEPSERQWDNVSRLILLVGSVLDTGYRRNYSTIVAVSDLLDRQLDS